MSHHLKSARAFTPSIGTTAIRSISIRMMLAMSTITIIGALMMIAGIMFGSRHEATEQNINPSEVTDGRLFKGAWIIDSEKAVIFIIFFVIGIIAATGVVAWYFSQREIAPMQEAMRLQRNFVADASHELKTPLAVIGARTELLDHRSQRGKALEPVIEDLKDDVTRMDSVINDLLLAAQSATKLEPTDLVSATQNAINSVALLAGKEDVTIYQVVSASSTAPITVVGGQIGIERCIVAVLDNAIAHSPSGSTIEVTIGSDNTFASVTVRDHGSGISSDPERLFTRFSRADSGSDHQGYGLGLALARDITSRYQGRIDVIPVHGDGTALQIVLPLAH
ncbi:sensor histidine kinase [Bifidobacterium fermentum]|uniref:histidine kinase n=2 Tax=Bifidobacterium TaxID=1678 RepID=A0AB39UBX1_9BIFI